MLDLSLCAEIERDRQRDFRCFGEEVQGNRGFHKGGSIFLKIFFCEVIRDRAERCFIFP